MPSRTSIAPPGDQPASSSGLMPGPLVENPRAARSATARPMRRLPFARNASLLTQSDPERPVVRVGSASGVNHPFVRDTMRFGVQEST